MASSNIQRHNKDTFGLYQAETSSSQNLVDVELHQNCISVLRVCLDGDFSTEIADSCDMTSKSAKVHISTVKYQVWVIRTLSNFCSVTNSATCIFDCNAMGHRQQQEYRNWSPTEFWLQERENAILCSSRHWQIVKAFTRTHVSPDFLVHKALESTLPFFTKIRSAQELERSNLLHTVHWSSWDSMEWWND